MAALSGSSTTMFCFLPILRAYLIAPATAAPDEPPQYKPFEPHQVARHQEALLVVDAHDVVEQLGVERRREEVLADAFDLVRERLGHALGLDVVVVERADRIDADQLHLGLLLLQDSARRPPSCRRCRGRRRTRRSRRRCLPRSRARSSGSGRPGCPGCGTGWSRSSSASRARCAWRPSSSCAGLRARPRSGTPRRARPTRAATRSSPATSCPASRTRTGSRAPPRSSPGPRRCCRWWPRRSCRPACSSPRASACVDQVQRHAVLHRTARVHVLALDVDVGGDVVRRRGCSLTSGVLPIASRMFARALGSMAISRAARRASAQIMRGARASKRKRRAALAQPARPSARQARAICSARARASRRARPGSGCARTRRARARRRRRAASRHAPAYAIIAALSVQRAAAARTARCPRARAALCAQRAQAAVRGDAAGDHQARARRAARTPPGTCSTSSSTTTCWNDAHRSASCCGSSGRPCVRTCCATAVLRPEKLNSRLPGAAQRPRQRTRCARRPAPRACRRAGRPDSRAPSSFATLSNASPAASSRVWPSCSTSLALRTS